MNEPGYLVGGMFTLAVLPRKARSRSRRHAVGRYRRDRPCFGAGSASGLLPAQEIEPGLALS
jgi:hypothetical protein